MIGEAPAGPAYTYRASCDRVVDGDTFIGRIDLGFRVEVRVPVRIRNLWSPELREAGGPEAREFLRSLIGVGLVIDGHGPLLVQSYRDERSFERWICDAWALRLVEGAWRWQSLAEMMIAGGHGTATR